MRTLTAYGALFFGFFFNARSELFKGSPYFVKLGVELAEILRYGIGNVGLIEIGFGDAFTVAAHYSCGNAHRGRVCGDIAENHGSCGDFGIVADREIAEKLRTRADHYVISERRMAFSGFLPCAAESHSLVYRAVVADYRGLADHDSRAVVDEKSSADRGTRMDLDPRKGTRRLTYQACGEVRALSIAAWARR